MWREHLGTTMKYTRVAMYKRTHTFSSSQRVLAHRRSSHRSMRWRLFMPLTRLFYPQCGPKCNKISIHRIVLTTQGLQLTTLRCGYTTGTLKCATKTWDWKRGTVQTNGTIEQHNKLLNLQWNAPLMNWYDDITTFAWCSIASRARLMLAS